MKKKVLSMLLVSIMVVSMVSCSNKNDADKDNSSSTSSSVSKPNEDKNQSSNSTDVSVDEPDVNINAEDLAKKLLKEVKFKDQMSKIDKDMALLQYNLTDNEVEEVVMYLSTGATAEEIAIFKVKDDAKRQVQSAVEKRVSDKKTSFKDYNPEELEKLKNPTMYLKDEYIALCISDEDDKSQKVIDEYMSK